MQRLGLKRFSLTWFLLLFVHQQLIQALLQFVKFSLFPFHLMIVLAGPAGNYVLKFLHLAGENKTSFYRWDCHVHPPETKNLPVDSFSVIWAKKSKESTSSFSFFRQFCKLFTFKCSCRSLSSSPVFSLLDSSSCSYDDRTILLFSEIDRHHVRFSLVKHAIDIFYFTMQQRNYCNHMLLYF